MQIQPMLLVIPAIMPMVGIDEIANVITFKTITNQFHTFDLSEDEADKQKKMDAY